MKGLFLIALLLLTGCGNAINDVVSDYSQAVREAEKSSHALIDSTQDQFTLPAYNYQTSSVDRRFWATYYYTHVAQESGSGEYLRNKHGSPVSPKISKKDWCRASLQGSIMITHRDGKIVTYTYHKKVNGHGVTCRRRNRDLIVNARFKKAKSLYGETSANEALRPYRSIAVDKSRTPLGTVFYIPAARGTHITLTDGSIIEHDGYFYATDTGSGIKGSQVDIYIGIKKTNPFGFVKSRPSGKFDAYIVKDQEIINFMKRIHKVKP